MLLNGDELFAYIISILLPFFRLAALFMTMPVIGTKTVPVRIRLFLTVVVTFIIFPVLPTPEKIDPFSITTFLAVMQQVIIGAALGLSIQLVFQAFVVAGQVIAMQSGLGFASMIDPQSGVSVPVVSQMYIMLITLIFLAVNGHLYTIDVLIKSFYILPVSDVGISRFGFWAIVESISWVLSSALLIALPSIISLLIVNIAFGIMTRAAPQLNIFTIGFPITLVIGIVILAITIKSTLFHFPLIMEKGALLMNNIIDLSV